MSKSREIDLGPVTQVPAGEGRVFEFDGEAVAIFHDRWGGVFATQAKCPHAAGPLADGLVGRGTVVCPLHERTFALDSGQSTNSDCRIRVYPVSLSSAGNIILEWN